MLDEEKGWIEAIAGSFTELGGADGKQPRGLLLTVGERKILMEDGSTGGHGGSPTGMASKRPPGKQADCQVYPRNTTIEHEEYIDDLVGLPYLNEPSVLNSLSLRYIEERIYTNAGIVLVSVNPCREIEGMYSLETMKRYSRAFKGEPGLEGGRPSPRSPSPTSSRWPRRRFRG